VQRTLSSRLNTLESQGFLLSLSQEDHLDLVKRKVNGTSAASSMASVPGRAASLAAGGFEEDRPLSELVEAGVSWQVLS
jgi:hypothetical protein